MIPRLSRIAAVARRDLRSELVGRRGLGLPLVIVGLLLPISGAPTPSLPTPDQPPAIVVAGEVPPAVEALDHVVRGEGPGTLVFEDGEPLKVAGGFPPDAVREVLDRDDPGRVAIERRNKPLPLPGRTLLFALISASTLTGAVSASIGGERSARTLVALLSAAVTRAEVILGKWFAWAGLGTVSAVGAAAVAILAGRVEAGWWLLPMVSVPMCAVALSLWLVRRASDVIGGTTVTLRVVPAVIGTGGILSWFVGLDTPLLGAAIPLGGSLVAAGSTWGPGPGPALIATASTLAATGLMLWSTWSDLEETIGAPTPPSPRGLALRTATLGAVAWWTPLTGPLLFAAAGNATLTHELDRGPGVLAAAFGLGLISWTTLARSTEGIGDWARRPPPTDAALAVAAGLAMALFLPGAVTPLPEAWGELQSRLAWGLRAEGALVAGLASALAVETLFRGWLQERAGEWWSLLAWILVCAPLDPIGGLVSGLALAALSKRGGVWCAVLAHSLWLAPISPW